jgi:hypothetical protein
VHLRGSGHHDLRSTPEVLFGPILWEVIVAGAAYSRAAFSVAMSRSTPALRTEALRPGSGMSRRHPISKTPFIDDPTLRVTHVRRGFRAATNREATHKPDARSANWRIRSSRGGSPAGLGAFSSPHRRQPLDGAGRRGQRPVQPGERFFRDASGDLVELLESVTAAVENRQG